MKKVLAVIALTGLLVSCKDKKDEKKMEETTVTPTTPTTTEPTTTEPTTTTTPSGIPTFSDPEVQKFVNDYTTFVTGYVDAYRTKDYSKIQEWSTKAADWSSRTMSIAQKLSTNADEATKFSNYMTKLSQDISAAMNTK